MQSAVGQTLFFVPSWASRQILTISNGSQALHFYRVLTITQTVLYKYRLILPLYSILEKEFYDCELRSCILSKEFTESRQTNSGAGAS